MQHTFALFGAQALISCFLRFIGLAPVNLPITGNSNLPLGSDLNFSQHSQTLPVDTSLVCLLNTIKLNYNSYL